MSKCTVIYRDGKTIQIPDGDILFSKDSKGEMRATTINIEGNPKIPFFLANGNIGSLVCPFDILAIVEEK